MPYRRKYHRIRVENFDEITLGETLPILRKTYPEITELSVDHNQFVTLQAIDNDEMMSMPILTLEQEKYWYTNKKK